MFKSEKTAPTANNSSDVQTRMTIGFKPQIVEVPTAEVISVPETTQQNNRYLECLLDAFTEFIKKEARGINTLSSINTFSNKVKAAQFLYSEERKELSNLPIIKSL